MPSLKSIQEQFIECAIDIYKNLNTSEKEGLIYKDLIIQTMEKLYGEKCYKSRERTGYEYFRVYYFNHPHTKASIFPKDKDERIYLEDIKTLLEYDTRKESLLNALDGDYRYYWYDQKVTFENNIAQSRRFLILESDVDSIKEVYRVIDKSYGDLYESAFLGSGGIVIIFHDTKGTNYFNTFIDYIKKENKE